MATSIVSMPPMPPAKILPVTDTSVADPAPLGLAAFALTTFVLSCVNAGFIGKGGDFVVLGLALAYGGLAQFGAGMWNSSATASSALPHSHRMALFGCHSRF
jgi:succinate-acetate transporter protein